MEKLSRNKKQRLSHLFIFLIMIVIFMVRAKLYAQDPGFDNTARFDDRWRKEGQLVTVQLSKGNPIKIFVLGREEAKVDLKHLKVVVRRLKPYPGQILKINQMGNYYEIADPQSLKSIHEIEVVTHLKDKKETFQFKLNQDVHEK